MDSDIYALVAKYGFKNLHIRLTEIMREEYAYFQTQFQPANPVREIVSVAPPPSPKKKKEKKLKINIPAPTPEVQPVTQTQEVQLSQENIELKDVIVSVSENKFRDPKEMKEYQRLAVEERKRINDAAGIHVSDVLTRDNLNQWLEVDGQTYAWIAREKAGCPETQVSATAKMMGLKSNISKKIGRIMTGN
jgi:hypothetical protein